MRETVLNPVFRSLLVAMFCTAFSTYGQGALRVTPSALSFGDVEVGSSVSRVVTVENTGVGPILFFGATLTADSSPDFAITDGGEPAFLPSSSEDPANGVVEVTVTFAPTSDGAASGALKLESTDFSNPSITVTLSGSGLVLENPPEAQIKEILAFISTAVEAGTLEGAGPNAKSANNRLGAFVNMIETAGGMIEAGSIEDAMGQLTAAARKVDSSGRPSGFVTGSASGELVTKINTLISDLAGL